MGGRQRAETGGLFLATPPQLNAPESRVPSLGEGRAHPPGISTEHDRGCPLPASAEFPICWRTQALAFRTPYLVKVAEFSTPHPNPSEGGD